MEPMTRRGFISGTAAGLAAAGVAIAMPSQMAGASTAARATTSNGPATAGPGASGPLDGPLIAHVRDVSSGEISLFAGEREIVIRDRHLASRLAGATRGR